MVRKTLCALVASWTLGALVALTGSTAQAAHPDIFYNFYQGPTQYGAGAPAQLYVSPRPTPPLVGHTWITYPPLLPHEFLYHHKRCYYKYYREGGFATSHVCYHTNGLSAALSCLKMR